MDNFDSSSLVREAVSASTASPTKMLMRAHLVGTITEHFQWAIELENLTVTLGESNLFCGDRARQVTSGHLYSGGGRIIAVDNLATAFAALDEIVEQGEGAEHIEVWDGDRNVFHPDRHDQCKR